jgi:hypothetical protein
MSLPQKVLDDLPGILAIVLIFGGGTIIAIVAMIVSAVKTNRENERIAVLKQQMLDRGMSAEEIVRVIEAGKAKE